MAAVTLSRRGTGLRGPGAVARSESHDEGLGDHGRRLGPMTRFGPRLRSVDHG